MENNNININIGFEKEVKSKDVDIRLSVWAFVDKIIPAFLMSLYSGYLWYIISSTISRKGEGVFKLGHMLTQSWYFTPFFIIISFYILSLIFHLSGRRFKVLGGSILTIVLLWVVGLFFFKTIAIPSLFVNLFFGGISLFSLLTVIYYVRYAQTATVIANPRVMRYVHGIFTTGGNSTNMSRIQDQDYQQSFTEKLLGLITVSYKETGVKERQFISGLNYDDGMNLFHYFEIYGFSSAVELWRAKDSRSEQKRIQKEKGISDEELMAIMENFKKESESK